MRRVLRVWFDDFENSVEVRFDDGGVSSRMTGNRAKDLADAFDYAAQLIRDLERKSPYPPTSNAELRGATDG